MFERTSKWITAWLKMKNIIESDKVVIVQWGIRHILDTIFNIITFLIIGFLMHMPIETIVFTIGYIPLRSFAGGYHAKTPFRCWIVSNLILLAALVLTYFGRNFPIAITITALFSVVLLIALMPVSDIHKPLNDDDRRRYKKKGTTILFFEVLAAIVLFFLKIPYIAYSLLSIWILLLIILIFGKIKNKLHKR